MQTNSFKYLGAEISATNNNMLHINKRKKTIIGSVAKLQSTGKASENIHPHLQAEMFKVHIRPILYYVIENHHLSQNDMKTIKRIEGNALKRIIDISTHCKSTDLFLSFNMMITYYRIKWLKLKHFLRMTRNELTNSILVELENKYIKNSFIEEIKEITIINYLLFIIFISIFYTICNTYLEYSNNFSI